METKEYWEVKREVLEFYGGVKCSCVGCNREPGIEFLTVNDGVHFKKPTKKSEETLYAKLKKGGFPIGYQVNCFNCHMASRENKGTCPHAAAL